VGTILAAAGGIGVLLGKPAAINRYEIFACGALMIWLPSWHRLFQDESPMFYFFPLYLALVASGITVGTYGLRSEIDEQTLKFMNGMFRNAKIHSILVMGLVIAAIQMTKHYLVFPIAMTLLMFRFAFDEYLKRISRNPG
ncbi:MAG: hypothetical protein ACU84J_13735, partial [Gammaproteobacteria bacterium]